MLALLMSVLSRLAACDSKDSNILLEAEVPGITDTEIRIGSSLALSGHAGYLGTQTLHGAKAFLESINKAGGIHGRTIRLISYDDGYDPPRCLANTQRLIVEDRVFSLFCYVGTPTTVKIIPLIEEARIPLVGVFTGANALREPFNRYIINIRASYYQETDAMVQHLVADLGLSRIAVFYQYDAYGFDGLKGAELALKKYGRAPVATGSYIRGTMDIEEGLAKIIQSGAEAVVMIGTYEPCAEFIRSARARGYNPIFYNISFVGANEIAKRLGKDAEGVILTQVVPPPEAAGYQTHLWGTVEYSNLHRLYFPEDEPNFVGLEGYINAKVLVEGLNRCGRELTRERFIDAIESIQEHSLGIANTLTFSSTDHQGLEDVYFIRIENGKFVLITDWLKIKREIQTTGTVPH